MFKGKISKYLPVGIMAVVGLVAGIAGMAAAQSSTVTPTTQTNSTVTTPSTTTAVNQAVDTPEPGDVADTPGTAESKTQGHAPLGGDGVVSSVSGTTIVLGEESNEGGASYTVDASKATVTNNGVTGTLADVKVGEKIFVQGVTTGTNVSATSISIGHKGEGVDKVGDTDGSSNSETSEPAGSSDTSEQ